MIQYGTFLLADISTRIDGNHDPISLKTYSSMSKKKFSLCGDLTLLPSLLIKHWRNSSWLLLASLALVLLSRIISPKTLPRSVENIHILASSPNWGAKKKLR